MKQLFILVDLAKHKVVFTSDNLDIVNVFEDNHQELALYLIELKIDKKYPCCRGLYGVAL